MITESQRSPSLDESHEGHSSSLVLLIMSKVMSGITGNEGHGSHQGSLRVTLREDATESDLLPPAVTSACGRDEHFRLTHGENMKVGLGRAFL